MNFEFLGTDSLELEVVRTKDILSASTRTQENKCMKRGYMWRQTINKQYTSSWMLRFFRLKEDHCLYCYKNEFVSNNWAFIIDALICSKSWGFNLSEFFWHAGKHTSWCYQCYQIYRAEIDQLYSSEYIFNNAQRRQNYLFIHWINERMWIVDFVN